jgi:hypothetical protein
MNTAQRIQTMISNTMCVDDILLVLISGNVLYTENDLFYVILYSCIRKILSTKHGTWIF